MIKSRPLESLTSNHLPLTAVGLNPPKGHWILLCDEDIQLAYGKSVVLVRCPLVPEKMHGCLPEVFLHQCFFTVLVQLKTQQKE